MKNDSMAEPDPNWFYSALAQSAAAIFGLIGAFIASKLIDQAKEAKDMKFELKQDARSLYVHLSRAKKQIFDLRRILLSIVRNLRRQIGLLESDRYQNGEKSRIENTDVGIELNFRRSESNIFLELLEREIKQLENILIRINSLTVDPRNEKIEDEIIRDAKEEFKRTWTQDPTLSQILRKPHYLFNYFTELETFKNMVRDFSQRFNMMKSRIVPTEFFLGIVILIPLSILGVILPLYSIPYPEEKKMFMIPFTFLIVLLCEYFTYEILKIRQIVTCQRITFEDVMSTVQKREKEQERIRLRTDLSQVLDVLQSLAQMNSRPLLQKMDEFRKENFCEEPGFFFDYIDGDILGKFFNFSRLIEEIRYPSQRIETGKGREEMQRTVQKAIGEGEEIIASLS